MVAMTKTRSGRETWHKETLHKDTMTQRISRQLLLPHFSQLRSLRLHVHFANAGRMAEGLAAMQQITSLYLDGRWANSTLQRAIGTLKNLRELGFPDNWSSCTSSAFSQAIQNIDTLHITNLHWSEARQSFVGPRFVAPRIRVLTLVFFQDLTFGQLRAILEAFPSLQRLSFRLCEPKQDAEVWKPRVLADPAFAGREAGWLDKIDLDEDVDTTDLYRFDEGTGVVVRSTWDLRGLYQRQIKPGGLLGPDSRIEGNRLVPPCVVE